MDHIWHMESMDLRMTPYTSVYWVPRGYDHNAKTDYQIQRLAGSIYVCLLGTPRV